MDASLKIMDVFVTVIFKGVFCSERLSSVGLIRVKTQDKM